MKIRIPKEIKNNENRVGITPAGVHQFVAAKHSVLIEHNAGLGAGYPDEAYEAAGATIGQADEAWQNDLIIKVKEPLPSEYGYLRPDLLLYTYLHLAANKPLTEALLKAKTTAIGYETMMASDGSLPALTPMSEVAGRMAVVLASQFLQTQYGGRGILISGVPGIAPARVTIIGGGVVGRNAAKVALGMGARTTVLDTKPTVLAKIDDEFGGRVETLFSTAPTIAADTAASDIVIGAVLIPGAKAPKLVTEEMVRHMKPGAVLVDIPVDQGGIFATTTRATTFADPVYRVHDVIHYAVANIPGAVPKTATDALTNVTIPYALQLAALGVEHLAKQSSTFATGINTFHGELVEPAVAKSLALAYVPLSERL